MGRPRAAARLAGPRRRAATTTAGRRGSARPWSTRDGAPVSFLDVHVPAHLAFYRAGIAAVTDEDAVRGPARLDARRRDLPAALRRRPGARAHARARGAGARRRVRRRAGARLPEPGWTSPGSTTSSVSPTTSGSSGSTGSRSRSACATGTSRASPFEVGEFTFEPVGPWRARVSPWPFVERTLACSLVRRLVPKRPWRQAEFRDAFRALPAERVAIGLEA